MTHTKGWPWRPPAGRLYREIDPRYPLRTPKQIRLAGRTWRARIKKGPNDGI